jgi:RecB family exonuclease
MTTTEPLGVSNTEITTFQRCRRKWWLSYYEKWRPRETAVVGPLALGSRVHAALEAYYKGGDDLVGHYKLLLEEDRMLLMASGMDTSDLDSEGELGRLMLEGYLEWVAEEGIDSLYEIVGVEEILSLPVLDGRVNLIGKIDLRVKDLRDGSHHVLDHKTSAQIGDYEKWAHMNPQLMTYQTLDHALRKAAGDEDEVLVGGIFRILKKVKRGPRAKPPFYNQFEIRHNIFTLRSFWTRLHGVLSNMLAVRDALDEGVDHRQVVYPTPSRDCSWYCFAGDTEVVTRQGIQRIDALVGGEAELLVPSRYGGASLTGDGRWESHLIKDFGEQGIYEVHLRRGRQTKVVRTTAEHLWWVDRGARRVATTELTTGQLLPSARSNAWKNVQMVPPAVAQGFVFGDGSSMGPGTNAMLDLHGSKDLFMLDFFGMHPRRDRTRKTPEGEKSFIQISQIPERWKWLPDITENASFLASWLAGYFAADGTVTKAGQASICSASREHLEFVRSVCAVVGIQAGPTTTKMRVGLGRAESALYGLSLSIRTMPDWMFLNPEHRARVNLARARNEHRFDWVVEQVVDTGMTDPVFCAVVPGDEAFVLADDLVTSNCPFVQVCPMFDDGSDTEGYLNEYFVKADPYAYYEDNDKDKES